MKPTIRTPVVLAVTALTATALVVAACANPLPVGASDRAASAADGNVLSVQHISALSEQQVVASLGAARFDTSAVKYGVDTYQIVYRTTDPDRRPTVASGLLVLPTNENKELRPVSFTHGTESYKFDVPSMTQRGFLPSPVLTYGAAGFAAVAPDYLGLGISPGTHPWMDVPSETTAAVDMLRAARDVAAGFGRSLADKVLVTGFSQGASAALGLARTLRTGAVHGFRLGAVAPVSGAYAFRQSELPALLDGRLEAKSSALYSAYLLVSWNRLHHLYAAPGEMFRKPYDTTVEHLFDTTVPGPQLIQGTPGTIGELLTPQAISLLHDPTGSFADALREADAVCDWTPEAPVRLYLMPGDEQAVNANTTDCQAAFSQHGVSAPIVTLPPNSGSGSAHLASNVLATAQIVRWFNEQP